MHDFLNYIKPRRQEDAIRRDVVERVKAVIQQLWPQAKVGKYLDKLDQYLYTTTAFNLRIKNLQNLDNFLQLSQYEYVSMVCSDD